VNLPKQRSGTGHSNYVRGLDGLRAIAVAVVVIFHATETWLRGGFLGVDVFFVLSGFLITSQLLAEFRQHRSIDVVAFWRRRARRILAALYLLLVATLSYALIVHPEEVAVFRGDALAAFAYVANWYFIFHNQPYFETVAHPSPLIHLWSLGVEEQFYLLWPLILAPALLLLRRFTPVLVLLGALGSCALMAALYHPEVDPSRVYFGTDTHASGLLIGALLAFYWRPGARNCGQAHWGGFWHRVRSVLPVVGIDLLALASLATLVAFFVLANDSQPFLYRGGFTIVAAMTAAAVVAVSHPRATIFTAVLELAPVRWLGRRSYSVYLWHWPVVVFTRTGVDVTLSGIPLLVLRVALSLALAECSYRLVEEPVRRGGLSSVWKRLQEAQQMRQWGRVLGTGIAGVLIGGFLLGICIAAAQAKTPAPPAYLAESSIDTIVRPGQASQPVSQGAANVTSTPKSALPAAAQPSGADTPLSTAAASSIPAASPAPVPAQISTVVSGTAASDGPVEAGTVIAIGDSVMLGAVPALSSAIDGIQVNATVSRQVAGGISLLQDLKSQGALGDVVVIGLGSNGTFTSGEFDQIMSVLSGVSRVVFINVKVPRSWEQGNDAVISGGVQRYQSARLVDWYDASVGHPEYFQADEYHLRPEGASVYASMVANVVSGP
jgi:peptidoglycan/LPS O-acetylase OafA/YrhL